MANIQPGGSGPPPKRQAKHLFCRKEGNNDFHVRRLTRRPLFVLRT